MEKEASLTHLGKKSTFVYADPDPSLLEAIANPFANQALNGNSVSGNIHIEAPEFTSLCPITGQPDFALLIIDYVPDKLCVESKSLKLYLGRFRQQGEFHEACVNRIANDLVTLLAPEFLRVEGRFTARGGISIWPVATYRKPAPPTEH